MTKASPVPGSPSCKTFYESFVNTQYCEYERITDYFEVGILRVVLHSDSSYPNQSSCRVDKWTANGWVHVHAPHPLAFKDTWAKSGIHDRNSGMNLAQLADKLLATAIEIIKTGHGYTP